MKSHFELDDIVLLTVKSFYAKKPSSRSLFFRKSKIPPDTFELTFSHPSSGISWNVRRSSKDLALLYKLIGKVTGPAKKCFKENYPLPNLSSSSVVYEFIKDMMAFGREIDDILYGHESPMVLVIMGFIFGSHLAKRYKSKKKLWGDYEEGMHLEWIFISSTKSIQRSNTTTDCVISKVKQPSNIRRINTTGIIPSSNNTIKVKPLPDSQSKIVVNASKPFTMSAFQYSTLTSQYRIPEPIFDYYIPPEFLKHICTIVKSDKPANALSDCSKPLCISDNKQPKDTDESKSLSKELAVVPNGVPVLDMYSLIPKHSSTEEDFTITALANKIEEMETMVKELDNNTCSEASSLA